MKTFCTLTMLAALCCAHPASAQSSIVMIIGKFPEQRHSAPRAALTDNQIIEIASENACEKPFLRDLKGQSYYHECLAEARVKARTQLAEIRDAGTRQLAAR